MRRLLPSDVRNLMRLLRSSTMRVVAIVVVTLSVNEVLVALWSDERADWSWFVPVIAPIVAGRLLGWHWRTLLVIPAYAIAMVLVDVLLAGTGWNSGQPAGWDLFDDDSPIDTLAEGYALSVYVTILALLGVLLRQALDWGISLWVRRAAVFACGALIAAAIYLPLLAYDIATRSIPTSPTATLTPPVRPCPQVDEDSAQMLITYYDPGEFGSFRVSMRDTHGWVETQERLGLSGAPAIRQARLPVTGDAKTLDEGWLTVRVWPGQEREVYVFEACASGFEIDVMSIHGGTR